MHRPAEQTSLPQRICDRKVRTHNKHTCKVGQRTLGEQPLCLGSQIGPGAGRSRLGSRGSLSRPGPRGGVTDPAGDPSSDPEVPPRDLERNKPPGWYPGGVSGPSRLDRGKRDPTSADEARSRTLFSAGRAREGREGWEAVCCPRLEGLGEGPAHTSCRCTGELQV